MAWEGDGEVSSVQRKLEASEAELEEAQQIATAANHKYEDVSRKLKVVQGDLDRVIERAEEFEAKSRLIETEGLVYHRSDLFSIS